MDKKLALSLILRFLRGGIAGAVSTMITIPLIVPTNYKDLGTLITALTLAGVIGLISGILQSIDKYIRS